MASPWFGPLGVHGFDVDHRLVFAQEAAGGVQHAVEDLGAPGEQGRVLDRFVGLREGVAEPPSVAPVGGELRVAGHAPFLEYRGDAGGGERARVDGADDEIVRLFVAERMSFVGDDSAFHIRPFVRQHADGLVADQREVAHDVRGVDPAQHDFAPEREIIAAEHPVARR